MAEHQGLPSALGVSGKGAEMSVMAQGLIVEHARAKREQVAATSIDIIKCFERVPHRVIQRVGLQWIPGGASSVRANALQGRAQTPL